MAIASPKQAPLRMTWEEFLAWGDEDTRAEWVDGEVIILSPTSRKHQKQSHFLLRMICEFLDENAVGEVFSDNFLMRLPVRPSGRMPDILYVSNEHLDRVTETFVNGPADLAIEIVSPDSEHRDRSDKLAEYEQAGVAEYWWVDEKRQAARFYRLGSEGRYEEVLPDEDGMYRSKEIPGLWLRLEWLWRNPKPTMREVRKDWKSDKTNGE